MATAFPAGVDSFPDPIGTDLLDNATALLKHATQHTNVNDAINALEIQLNLAGLLTGAGVPGAGLGVNTNLYLDTASGIVYRKTAGTWAAIYTPAGGGQFGTSNFTNGFPSVDRSRVTATVSSGSQTQGLCGFLAPSATPINNATIYVTGTATITFGYITVYSLDSSGNSTGIVAQTANTTTLFGATGKKTVAFTGTWIPTPGAAYAVGIYYTSGGGPTYASSPALADVSVNVGNVRPFFSARAASSVGGPNASFTFASLGNVSIGAQLVEFTT